MVLLSNIDNKFSYYPAVVFRHKFTKFTLILKVISAMNIIIAFDYVCIPSSVMEASEEKHFLFLVLFLKHCHISTLWPFIDVNDSCLCLHAFGCLHPFLRQNSFLAVHHHSGMSGPQSHLLPAWDEICTCFNRRADGYQRHHLREFRLARNSQMCIGATLWSCSAQTCLISTKQRTQVCTSVRARGGLLCEAGVASLCANNGLLLEN